MTLCEGVAGKRSLDGCGFRSGCPVVTVYGCDILNHATISHSDTHIGLHELGTHTHTHTLKHMRMQIQT